MAANCPTDGDWSSIAPGQTRVISCIGNTWGTRTRLCNQQNVWENVDNQFCIPISPPSGLGYVDFYYMISNSNYDRIKLMPSGINMAINDVYRVPESSVDTYYIGKATGAEDYTVVQVRVTTGRTEAESFYQQITTEQAPTRVAEFFHNNHATGAKLMYLKNAAQVPDISYRDKIELRLASILYPNNTLLIDLNQPFELVPKTFPQNGTFTILTGSLPTGLTLDPVTGVIKGTPSQTITNLQVTIKGCVNEKCEEAAMEFTVASLLRSFSYGKSGFKINSDIKFSVKPVMEGEASSFAITSGELPHGLELNTETGEISGTPIQASDLKEVEITASNAFGSLSVKLSFIVKELSDTILRYVIIIGVILLVILFTVIAITCCLSNGSKKMPIQSRNLI